MTIVFLAAWLWLPCQMCWCNVTRNNSRRTCLDHVSDKTRVGTQPFAINTYNNSIPDKVWIYLVFSFSKVNWIHKHCFLKLICIDNGTSQWIKQSDIVEWQAVSEKQWFSQQFDISRKCLKANVIVVYFYGKK